MREHPRIYTLITVILRGLTTRGTSKKKKKNKKSKKKKKEKEGRRKLWTRTEKLNVGLRDGERSLSYLFLRGVLWIMLLYRGDSPLLRLLTE